jgi:tetratricopeptide (TPR) repeat protein
LTITNLTKEDPYSVEPIRALMEYRRGSYASAKEWSNRIVTRKDGWLPRVAEGWFLQAMASARLQQIEPARTAYAWGDKLFNARPKDLKGDFLMADSNWQLTRLLRREATGMLGEKSAVFSNVEMESAGKAISLARRGHWKEAAAEFAETIKSQPNDHLAYRFLAPLLVANGDIEGYRQHCRRMIAQFGGTKDPGVADNVVKCCLILPFSGVDLKAMGELADRAVTLGNQSEYLPWFQLSKGLADYRLGHFAGATNWTQKALMSAGQQRERDAAAYLVLAIAQMQLKQASVARLALRKAAEILAEKLPKLDGADLGDQWNDRIIADALMREATALMEVAGPIGPDTLKAKP